MTLREQAHRGLGPILFEARPQPLPRPVRTEAIYATKTVHEIEAGPTLTTVSRADLFGASLAGHSMEHFLRVVNLALNVEELTATIREHGPRVATRVRVLYESSIRPEPPRKFHGRLFPRAAAAAPSLPRGGDQYPGYAHCY